MHGTTNKQAQLPGVGHCQHQHRPVLLLPTLGTQRRRPAWHPALGSHPRRKALRCKAAAQVATESEHTAVRTDSRPLKVMIAGAPAAGKGTQCEKIVKKFGLIHISAGDLLRAEVAAATDAGKKAEAFMSQGFLVPNELVVEMVKNRLSQEDAQASGWLLDGYPRSAEQAEAIEEAGIRPDVFILINVPDQELVERVTGRRLDPQTGLIYHLRFKPPPAEALERLVQRSDDTEAKLRNRLDTHHANVAAVLGYYKDITVEVDGLRSMDEVFAEIDGVLSAFRDEETLTYSQ